MGIAPRQQRSDASGVDDAELAAAQPSSAQDPFTIVSHSRIGTREIMRMDAYSAAKAFVEGRFTVDGDLFSAIRFFLNQPHSGIRVILFSSLAWLERLRTHSILGRRRQSAESIQFHYDRSNEFYAQFLDSRMVYSSAYFRDATVSLEQAQLEKLDRICKHLELKPGERLLDIGCGWGGLIAHAVEHYGVTALGCTLSREQLSFVNEVIERRGLSERMRAEIMDYRDLNGCFDKIASVGMFEHVGRSRLLAYFRKVYSLLRSGGLFLNRGVVRPQGVSDGPETLFLQRDVFPGGELVRLDDVVRHGERAGFAVTGMEDLRKHYARTCRAWVNNLHRNQEKCRALVGERTYRTWLLYLAASAVNFENGRTGCAEVVFSKG